MRLGILVAVLAIFLAICGSVSATPDLGDTTLFYEDYDSQTPGESPLGWALSGSGIGCYGHPFPSVSVVGSFIGEPLYPYNGYAVSLPNSVSVQPCYGYAQAVKSFDVGGSATYSVYARTDWAETPYENGFFIQKSGNDQVGIGISSGRFRYWNGAWHEFLGSASSHTWYRFVITYSSVTGRYDLSVYTSSGSLIESKTGIEPYMGSGIPDSVKYYYDVPPGYSAMWFDNLHIQRYIETVQATINIDPDTLNLRANGVFTAYITLPQGYDIQNIDATTIECEGAKAIRTSIENGVLVAKFNREGLIGVEVGDKVTLTVTGKLKDGTTFKGSDAVRVISQGK